MARPTPRKWKPKNPHKYAGDVNNIVSRSSWETKVMNYFDSNEQVILWNSEGLVIPYYNELDGKMHRYFVDFIAKIQTKTSGIKTYAIEVKPYKETKPPEPTKNKKRFLTETATYITNQAKWKHAREFLSKKGVEFLVLTEYELGIK